MIFVICTIVCLLLFCLRKLIFNYVGNIVYKMVQKSVDSCAGKLTMSVADASEEERVAQDEDANPAGFIINVKTLGQNFDLNARENSRFCTPTMEQDLRPTNDLA